MHILPFVFCFLIILSLFSSFFLFKVESVSQYKKNILNSFNIEWQKENNLQQKLFVFEKEERERETVHPRARQSNPQGKKTSPSNYKGTDRINLYPILREGDHNLELKKVFENLLYNLYGSNDYFQKKGSLEELVFQIKNVSDISKSPNTSNGKTKIENAEDLARLDLYNEEQKDVLYKILKGAKGGEGYPSLLEFVEINKSRNPKGNSINVFSAKKELLLAVFEREDIVRHIELIKKQIILERRTRDEKKEIDDFKYKIEQVLKNYGFDPESSLIDLSCELK